MNDFKTIWMPYAERFYRVAYCLLESEQDAEDAVQELYLRLWTAGDSLKNLRSPVSYGISVLRNICIDRIRRQEVRKSGRLDENIPQNDDSPDSLVSSRDLLEKLLSEIGRLPFPQAAVLKMKALEGLDYREISERTGYSQVHVRVLISKARKTLKRKLII